MGVELAGLGGGSRTVASAREPCKAGLQHRSGAGLSEQARQLRAAGDQGHIDCRSELVAGRVSVIITSRNSLGAGCGGLHVIAHFEGVDRGGEWGKTDQGKDEWKQAVRVQQVRPTWGHQLPRGAARISWCPDQQLLGVPPQLLPPFEC